MQLKQKPVHCFAMQVVSLFICDIILHWKELSRLLKFGSYID